MPKQRIVLPGRGHLPFILFSYSNPRCDREGLLASQKSHIGLGLAEACGGHNWATLFCHQRRQRVSVLRQNCIFSTRRQVLCASMFIRLPFALLELR